MRSITISTDIYAALWAAREPGEDNEEDILRRLLGVKSQSPKANQSRMPSTRIGFSDPRFGIQLPEGFEIFRVYKGKEYRAKAVDGKWTLMNTGVAYPSLNQLSAAVTNNAENAWYAWYFTSTNGKRTLITSLRNSGATH